jgi:hypothetical protein
VEVVGKMLQQNAEHLVLVVKIVNVLMVTDVMLIPVVLHLLLLLFLQDQLLILTFAEKIGLML